MNEESVDGSIIMTLNLRRDYWLFIFSRIMWSIIDSKVWSTPIVDWDLARLEFSSFFSRSTFFIIIDVTIERELFSPNVSTQQPVSPEEFLLHLVGNFKPHFWPAWVTLSDEPFTWLAPRFIVVEMYCLSLPFLGVFVRGSYWVSSAQLPMGV